MSPLRQYTQTLPRQPINKAMKLPLFTEVLAEHGPRDEEGTPTGSLPAYEPPEWESWMADVDREVAERAALRDAEIAAEVAEEMSAAKCPPLQLASDVPLVGDYTLSWDKPSTAKPIRVRAERLPSPRPRAQVAEGVPIDE